MNRAKPAVWVAGILWVLFLCGNVFAATFYVDGSQADDGGNGRSWAQAKKYIYSGIQLLGSGDTLIVKDGNYTNDLDRIRGMPSGTSGSYTTIKAESDFGVVLSGLNVGVALAPEQAVVNIYQKSWVSIEGFIIKDCQGSGANTLSAIQMYNSDHCRLRKIGIKNGTHPAAEYSGGISTDISSYCLFEDIFICGMMRYGINVGGGSASHHNILRRVVVRWDYCTTAQPRAAITVYGAGEGLTPNSNILLQNCIVVDGNLGSGSTFTGGFSVPHETSFIQRYGCISLNNRGYGFHSSEDSLSHDNTNTHCVNWDSDSGMWWRRLASGMSGAYNNTSNRNIDGGNNGASFCEAVNNIMVGGAAISNMSSTTGNVNRNASAFTYILRSPVAGAGATIEKQMGVTGTIYGETGYDTLTGTNLWPFPNEDQIRNLFRESNDPPSGLSPSTNNTTRGFCADGQTLTKYIWEYLGNAMPVELYNAPVLAAIGNQSVDENANLDFTISATDVNGDPLTYSVSGLPSGASFNASSHRFTWTPTYSQAGGHTVTFSVNDGTGDGGTDSETIIITVNNVNTIPVLANISNKHVNGNSNLTFTLSSSDEDGDTLTYSAIGLPSGATLNSSTGVFNWTPANSQEGAHNVTFNVSDGNGGSDSEAIVITVTNTNHSPTIAGPGNKKVNAKSTLSFTLKVNDADGDAISYSAVGLPSGAIFNTSTGAFSWTPTDDQIGSYSVTFNVDDGNSGVDSRTITITVRVGKIKYQAGWPKSMGGSVSSASLSDLDGDGDLEVIACYTTATKTYVCAWHHEGTAVSGWSGKELSGVMNFAPGIADIDKDKLPEIIMGDENGRVWVWNGDDGSLVAGFGDVFTPLYDDILTAPVTGDVDGDGDMEIIVGTGDNGGGTTAYLYVIDKSGSTERQLLVTNKIRSTPALGDIDGDGDWEIVVGCDDNKVYAWNHDGTPVSGFSVTTGNKVSSSPALGDIDNNGDIEIVVGSEDGGLYVWNHDGSPMANWPKMTGSIITSSPALGDINGDGDLEIAVGSENGYLYVWDYLGSQVFLGSADEAIKFSSPAVGDIDGDGDKEVVVGSDSDGVYAWHHNGVLVDGFALETSDDVRSSPTLADLDKDGDIELIVGSNDQRLHIWDLPGKFNSRNIDWGMFHMNPRYGGFYQKKTRLSSVKITPVERRYVGTAGGTLYVEDATSNIFGLELTIPANAISADTNIEIGEAENSPVFSSDITAVGTPVDFTSMNFSVPVMIKIPYTQAMLDAAGLTTAGNLKIYTYNESALTWSEPSAGSTVDTANRVVWIMVDHFSLFGLGAVAVAGAGGSSAGGGGGCFIATAAFGAYPAIETQILTDFRDRYLMTNKSGRSFVKFYYQISPPIAAYIAKREWARARARSILRPLVWMAEKTLEK